MFSRESPCIYDYCHSYNQCKISSCNLCKKPCDSCSPCTACSSSTACSPTPCSSCSPYTPFTPCNPCSPCTSCTPCTSCSPCINDQDLLITQLKAEIFDKEQKIKDLNDLQAQFNQLQNNLSLLSTEKLKVEYEMCQLNNESNKMVCDLRTQNDNLTNNLNVKIGENQKLYCENNNLFRELEGKNAESHCLQDKLSQQEHVINHLSEQKNIIDQNICAMSQAHQCNLKDIQNFQQQINCLSLKTQEQENLIKGTHCKNLNLIQELNEEKRTNQILCDQLKKADSDLVCLQNQLGLANDTINHLQSDYNNLSLCYNKNKNDIAELNNNILKENSIRIQIEDNNKKLEAMISDRNNTIQTITHDNDLLKVNVDNLDQDNNALVRKIDEFKRHIVTLSGLNESLVNELGNILDRDSRLGFTLERDTKLRSIQRQNKEIVESSAFNNLRNACLSKNNCCCCGMMVSNPLPQRIYEVKRSFSPICNRFHERKFSQDF